MHRPLKYAGRFVVVVALVAVVSVLLAPSSSTNSPYLSALSNMAVSGTLAATLAPCNNLHCGILRPNICNTPTSDSKCVISKTGACVSTTCP